MKKAVFGALGQRFSYISLEEDREKELEHIKSVLMGNGYPKTSVEAWSRQLERTGVAKEQDEMISTVCLPYVKGLSEAVAKILRGSNPSC